jgi:hypothetical protein
MGWIVPTRRSKIIREQGLWISRLSRQGRDYARNNFIRINVGYINIQV